MEATTITLRGWRFYNFSLLTSFKSPLDAWCDLYVLCMYCAVYLRSTFYWQLGSTHIVTYKLHAVMNMKVKFLQSINSLVIQCRKPALRSPRFLRSALRYDEHIYSDQNAKNIKRLYYFEDPVNTSGILWPNSGCINGTPLFFKEKIATNVLSHSWTHFVISSKSCSWKSCIARSPPVFKVFCYL